MKYLCIDLGEGSNACICMVTHRQPLLLNHFMDFDETCKGCSTHGPAHVFRLSAKHAKGLIQGRARKGQWGSLSQKTSSDANSSTNRMHSSDVNVCVKKCCYFWLNFEVKFVTSFYALLRKPISVTPRKIYYIKGVITRMKGVKTHLKAK